MNGHKVPGVGVIGRDLEGGEGVVECFQEVDCAADFLGACGVGSDGEALVQDCLRRGDVGEADGVAQQGAIQVNGGVAGGVDGRDLVPLVGKDAVGQGEEAGAGGVAGVVLDGQGEAVAVGSEGQLP